MIKHIVMFKLKNKADAEDVKREAEKLRDYIMSLRSLKVEINSDEAPSSNYDIALICEFDDMAGLNEYQEHPNHKKFGEYVYERRTINGRACIDYEIS